MKETTGHTSERHHKWYYTCMYVLQIKWLLNPYPANVENMVSS